MWTKERLVEAMNQGQSFDYLLFWGHTPKREGVVDRSCFSQWFPRPFEHEGVHYPSAEHFMMAGKARLFRDESALRAILAADSPAEAKALGRVVQDFDDAAWTKARSAIVVEGNLAKFGQHPDLRAHLQSTDNKVLVEASPRDTIWGIGMGASNPDARVPARWRGTNLLGFALMEVRARLARSTVAG